MSAAALLKEPQPGFDSKPHRYKLTFLVLGLTNGGSLRTFDVLNVRIGLDEPITQEVEDEWLRKTNLAVDGTQSVHPLGFSKYE